MNVPADADAATLKSHRVGLVSFFGIEHSTGSKDAQPLSYSFDITDVVGGAAVAGELTQLRVSLLPVAGTEADAPPAAVAAPPINVGTVARSVAHD